MSGMGASLLTKKVDPSMNTAIQNYFERGGAIAVYPPSTHGTCERRKGIQFGNGGTPKRQTMEEAVDADMQRRQERLDERAMAGLRTDGVPGDNYMRSRR